MFCSMNLSLLNITLATIVNSYFGGSLFMFYGTVALGVILVASLAVVGAVAYKKHKGKSKRKKLGANKENGQVQDNSQDQNLQNTQTNTQQQTQSRGSIFEALRENDTQKNAGRAKDVSAKQTNNAADITQTSTKSNVADKKVDQIKETSTEQKEEKQKPVIKKEEKAQPATSKNNSSAWVLNSPFEGGKDF